MKVAPTTVALLCLLTITLLTNEVFCECRVHVDCPGNQLCDDGTCKGGNEGDCTDLAGGNGRTTPDHCSWLIRAYDEKCTSGPEDSIKFMKEKCQKSCSYCSYSCNTNRWDSKQYCLCPPGYKLKQMTSIHDNYREDRRWTLDCEAIRPNFVGKHTPSYPSQTSQTDWDAPINFDFGGSGFMVGMKSYHDNGKEDRRFTFFYTEIDTNNWELTNCKWHTMNELDQKMDKKLTGDQVFAGIESKHDNGKEDRIWRTKICDLASKMAVCTTSDDCRYDESCHEYLKFCGTGCFRDNVGSAGRNMKLERRLASANQCQKKCQQTEGCEYFDYWKASKKCYLKNKDARSIAMYGATFGPKYCEGK